MGAPSSRLGSACTGTVFEDSGQEFTAGAQGLQDPVGLGLNEFSAGNSRDGSACREAQRDLGPRLDPEFAQSACPPCHNSRLCKKAHRCEIFKNAKENNASSEEVLEHLSQFIHIQAEPCPYGKDCSMWLRLVDGGEKIDDRCHCAIYKHAPRSQRDLGKDDEYRDARWRKWNTLPLGCADQGQCDEPVGNHFYNPLLPQDIGWCSSKELMYHLSKEAQEQALVSYSESSPEHSALQDEVVKEGLGSVLTCSDGQSLSAIVLRKMDHAEHRKLGSPLSYDGMLSIILYTGTDAYSGLRRYHLEHQKPHTYNIGAHGNNPKKKRYERWNVFDFTLDHAIRSLGKAQLDVYGHRRGLPSDFVYHGSYQCEAPRPEPHSKSTQFWGAELPTVTSFSWDIDVARDFANQEGLLIKFNAASALTDEEIAALPHQGEEKISDESTNEALKAVHFRQQLPEGVFRKPVASYWCDVSWISKFPYEAEALFSHRSLMGDLLEETVLCDDPSFTMYHYSAWTTYEWTHAGCIHEDCFVTMMDGSEKRVGDVVPGDLIKSSGGKVGRVACTIHTPVNDIMEMCTVSPGCSVTFEHPVKLPHSQEWKIPKEIVETRQEHVKNVCNFVLEGSAHAVIVDDVECVTLGHCLEHPVLKHQVWGSSRILAYLKDKADYPQIMLHGGYNLHEILRYPDVNDPNPKVESDTVHGGSQSFDDAASVAID